MRICARRLHFVNADRCHGSKAIAAPALAASLCVNPQVNEEREREREEREREREREREERERERERERRLSKGLYKHFGASVNPYQ